MIKLATLFSGIGAIEETLLKMNIDHKIVFACDNGDRIVDNVDFLKNKIKNMNHVDREREVKKFYDSLGKENLMELSYKANYKIDDLDFYQDVRLLDATIYKGNVDLMVGGSPCQSFSVNGKRGGFKDTRGTLFYEYARIIQECEPKVFIFENVKGMLTHDNGKTWEVIKNTFKELNYNIYIKDDPILNAKDYGIPQNRPRLFIIGIRNNIKLKKNFKFPNPIKLKKTLFDYLEKDVDSKYYLGQKGFEFVTTHPSRAQVNGNIMRCQKANQQFNWNGDFIFEPFEKIKNNKDILNKAYIGEWNGVKGVTRKLTPRECLRLMGFSDDFKIVVNDQNMYKQAGNSIVVDVLQSLVNSIIETGVFE